MTLQLEINDKHNDDPNAQEHTANGNFFKLPILVTPPIGKDYWLYRVKLHEEQAILAFAKFFTIGIGFAIEETDWNTNLPFTSTAEEIFNHIKHNKKYKEISDDQDYEEYILLREKKEKEK